MGTTLIEDGKHILFGSKYKGKYLGNHGNFVMNSLQPIKHITSVDGGLLYCPHNELYERQNYLDGMVSIEIQKVELILDVADIKSGDLSFI